jgi:signal transduction histidine kinase/putative methionine-R-sulfoxide reductase with GAF domain
VDTVNRIPELSTGITLENILSYIVRHISCDQAFFAIRRGDYLRIQSIWPNQFSTQGFDLSIPGSEALNSIFTDQDACLLQGGEILTVNGLDGLLPDKTRCWLGIPVSSGQRTIGIFAFTSKQENAFSKSVIQSTTSQINQITRIIEHAILFEEATRYLQQLALLNELATVASSEVDIQEVAKRILPRLRMIFNTDWAAIYLFSSDRKSLREYKSDLHVSTYPYSRIRSRAVKRALKSGSLVSVNQVRDLEGKVMAKERMKAVTLSELGVPLKYRSQVIGAISLSSDRLNAFSSQDEQLLTLISSQLAGVFENMRLIQETRERAQSLTDMVRQLEAARGTALDITADLDLDTLLRRIIQRARDLIGGRGAELGLLNYQEDETKRIVNIAVSENPWDLTPTEEKIIVELAEKIVSLKGPLLIDRFDHWVEGYSGEQVCRYKAIIGLPLMLRGEVIGVLIVIDDRPERKFTAKDIHLLELLIPQAAIAIKNAQLYTQTQLYLRQIQDSQRALIQAEKMATSGRLVASIAHEINNPLQALENCLHLVGRHELSQELRENYLHLAQDELIRLMNTVRRMLEFYRPGNMDRKPTDINEVLLKTLDLAKNQLEDSSIKVFLDLSEQLPLTLVVRDQIQQVFLNLILNAGEAMKNGGVLRIKTRTIYEHSVEPVIEISFTDSGPGIPKEHRDKVFEPFFSNKENGLGLGLAISYGIISAHDGILELVDHPGPGAYFRIIFKAVSPEKQ